MAWNIVTATTLRRRVQLKSPSVGSTARLFGTMAIDELSNMRANVALATAEYFNCLYQIGRMIAITRYAARAVIR